MCTQKEIGKTHCCTHDMDEKIMIEFTGEDLDMILKYQEASEADTVQYAIMNAISLALDHIDD